MRIALVYDLIYPYSKGGVEKRVHLLARGLAARGHDVHLFGMKQWDGPDEIRVTGMTLHGVATTRTLFTRKEKRSVKQGVAVALGLVQHLLSQKRFDVVDVQSMVPLSALTTVVLGRISRVPTLVTWHEVWGPYWRTYIGALGSLGSFVEAMVARLGENHAAVSETTARRLVSMGIDHVRVLPNGIETLNVDPNGGLAWDLVYVGRLARHKNLELLIDALRILYSEGFKPRTLIIGDGPRSDSLRRRAHGLENVRFTGIVESDIEVAATVAQARLFVLPSIREGFGLAALEAMARGVPVVTTSHPNNASTDLINSGVDGLVVSPTPTEFAGAMKNLLTSESVRREMGVQARQSAERYDMVRVLDLIEHAYRELSEVPMVGRSSK